MLDSILGELEGLTAAEPSTAVDGRSSLAFLQAVYRCTELPLSVRMRAARDALPYEHPKLQVTAVLDGTEDLGARLSRAIQRSAKVIALRAIEHEPIAPSNGNGAEHSDAAAVSAAAMRTPLVSYRRR
jgi:hypothetical protein